MLRCNKFLNIGLMEHPPSGYLYSVEGYRSRRYVAMRPGRSSIPHIVNPRNNRFPVKENAVLLSFCVYTGVQKKCQPYVGGEVDVHVEQVNHECLAPMLTYVSQGLKQRHSRQLSCLVQRPRDIVIRPHCLSDNTALQISSLTLSSPSAFLSLPS